jgi:hypothetical protein
MKWNLILLLSLFGLGMAFATVSLIPSGIEPFCWLGIFLVCAWIIAKVCTEKYFLHGLLISILNSAWITNTHIFMFQKYVAGHTKEALMMTKMPLHLSPKQMMLITGPVIGIASGIVLGLLAFGASKIVKARKV